MEFIGIGDLHFDKLNNLVPDVNAKIRRSLKKVFNYAIDNGVQTVLFYGDIGERPRLSYAAQVAFYSVILDPQFKDLSFHIILGNHDFEENGSHTLEVMTEIAKACRPNFEVYTQAKVVDIESERFQFLPYPFSETLKSAVNVGHFEVAGSLRDNGRQIDEGSNTKHQCVMGHLHTQHRVRNTWYSGTLYQTNFGETEEKFFHHAKVVDGRLQVKNVPFKSPWVLRNVRVNKESDVADLTVDDRVLYKLFVKDGLDIDLEKLQRDIPTIVKSNVFKNKTELELMLSLGWKLDQDLVDQAVEHIDEDALVKDHLSKVLNCKQVERGLDILSRLRGRSLKG